MKTRRRFALSTLMCCLLSAAVLAPGAHAAGSIGLADNGFGEPEWEAGTCNGSDTEAVAEGEVTKKENCSYHPNNPAKDFYTQAAGHPPWGLTGFKLAQSGNEPTGSTVKRIRVDVPPGLAADPQALGTCEKSVFEAEAKACPPDSRAGFVELKAFLELHAVFPILPNEVLTLKGHVYNLPLEGGKPLLFGIDVEGVPPLVKDVHLFLEGHVSYASEPSLAARGVPSGDYHEWFEIDNVPPEVKVEPLGLSLASAPLKTVESKLYFHGHAGKAGKENFLTMPSSCAAPSTSYLELETYPPVEHLSAPTTPPVKVEHCDKVPFAPTATVTPETSQYDTPDGIETDVHVPQKEGSGEINTADILDAHVTLPEGLTLNPSAAHGLEACTPAQLGRGTTNPVACPAGSQIGEVDIETDLPANSLKGPVFLGKPNGTGAIQHPPFDIFLDAESVYGVSVRLEGETVPNLATGRLEVKFLHNPQLPFSDLKLKLKGGPRAPLANGITCGKAVTDTLFTPWTEGAASTLSSPFTTTGCPSPVPFSIAQGTKESDSKGGAFTSFTFALGRNDGNQNLGKVQTVLPAGLVALIPSVTRCGEAQAVAGNCPKSSEIGKATALAGVGSEPYPFAGPVYLTGPIGGAPFGLSIPIEAAAGPFDLGRITTVATIGVDVHTGRVIATATLPTIHEGVPLHLRGITVEVTKSNFMFNPTNCGPLSTNSLLTSTQGATTGPATPFQVSGCSSLPFKPVFAARSPSTPSRAKGASLVVSYTQPQHQANIKSVTATLPPQLPSRLTTLHNACPEGVWAGGANFKSCPAGSKVGSATVKTPVLPEPLSGPAYLVSHGGAAFPDLDLILEGDHGVKVILEGNTNIKNGITTSKFASVPDVPVSSFELNLPTGPNSALGSFGSLCSKPLYLPTLVTAQSGTVSKQNVRISVGSCKIKLRSHRVKGHKLILRVQVFTAGRLSVKSPGLHTTFKKVHGPGIVTLKVPVSIKGRHALSSGRRLNVRFRVGFNPAHKGEYHSAVFAKALFKH